MIKPQNILQARRGLSPDMQWLAIDPKGLVGEPAYEIASFLYNPLDLVLASSYPLQMVTQRVDIFVERLGHDRSRLLGWSLVQAVLSSWWSYEDLDKN